MPFYEYECAACRYYVEVLQKITDAPLKKCPSCGKLRLKRLISAPVFRLKGSGWYETDFKSDKENKRNLAGAEPAPAEAKPAEAKGSETKSSETKAPDTKASESKAEPAAKSEAAAKPAAAKSPAKSAAAKGRGARKRPAARSAPRKRR
jgi:putative FmdB family regulatory protein